MLKLKTSIVYWW